MPRYARDGYSFYRVITPQVFEEYELPDDEKQFSDDDAAKAERLADLADQHRTSIETSSYARG